MRTITEMQVLLHYFVSPEEWKGDMHEAAFRAAITSLLENELIRPTTPEEQSALVAGDFNFQPSSYIATDRGIVLCEAMRNLPLPVQVWKMP